MYVVMADLSWSLSLKVVSSAVVLVVALLASETTALCNGVASVVNAGYGSSSLTLPFGYYLDSQSAYLDTNCRWLLQASYPFNALYVNVIFVNLNTSCTSARLEIFDGGSETSPLLARLCGKVSHQTFNSSGSSVLVSLTTDLSTRIENFYVQYSGQTSRVTSSMSTTSPNPACVAESQSTLYASDFLQYLNSPNYYGMNSLYSDCRWLLRSVNGGIVKIVVRDLRIQYTEGCTYSYLDIFDGASTSYPRLARLCGYTSGQAYNSTGGSLYLSFSSLDGEFRRYGFSLQYVVQRPASTTTTTPTTTPWWWILLGSTTTIATARVPTRLTAAKDYVMYFTSPNYPNPYPANVYYTWLLESDTYGYKVMIVVEKLSLELYDDCRYDRLEIFDGASDSSRRLARLCGDQSSQTFYSSGSTAFIAFKTDGTVQKSGFKIAYSAVWSGVNAATTPSWWRTTMPMTYRS